MNLIYMFRWLVVAQVLMGIVSFCMAEQNPGMLLVAGAIGALSWYVVEGPSGQPLPRWVTNAVGPIAAVAWLIFDLYWQKGNVIIAMGHFTMWLQILELYARKTNRDYGLILVLSLLQMVGATILSVSVIFGILLIAYCVLALFTVLLFQLKSASDLVMARNEQGAPSGVRISRPESVTTRGHRWQFRTTSIAIGAVTATIAVLVFVLIPRTTGLQSTSELLKPLTKRQAGFSPRVQLEGKGPIAENREVVATVRITSNDGDPSDFWLLRGAALDSYDPYSHTWTRSLGAASHDLKIDLPEHGRVELAALPDQVATTEAQITLRDIQNRTLFTLHPIAHIATEHLNSIIFNPTDQQLLAVESRTGSVTYTVQSPASPPVGYFARYRKTTGKPRRPPGMFMRWSMRRRPRVRRYGRHWSVQKTKISQYAQQVIPEDVPMRDPFSTHDPNDKQIADALSKHLRTFEYTLENPPTRGTDDPIVEFLYDHKRGHCELFASALAAMCRSIGIGARVITGYCVSEFNRIGGYYVVRQNNAHAWCEIDLGEQGWQTYDATPPADVEAEHHVQRSWLTSARELYEYLEFVWLRSVVTYDEESRLAALSSINQAIRHRASNQATWLGTTLSWAKAFWHEWRFNQLNLTLIVIFAFFILVGFASLLRTWFVRRRRLIALQLNRLPRRDQRGLARRLRFYLTMLDMLERHGFHRPNWQSPFSFAQELADQRPRRFDAVIGLTEAFYEIRFGHRHLDDERRRHIKALLRDLERTLSVKA